MSAKRKVVSSVILDLLEDLGEAGSIILYEELRNDRIREDFDLEVDNRLKVARGTSAYVPGVATPTADDIHRNSQEIRVRNTSTRTPQRVVATRGFYKSPHIRQDSVLIETKAENNIPMMHLWVAKVLCILRSPVSNNLSTCNGNADAELAFVQFYDVVPEADEVDKL